MSKQGKLAEPVAGDARTREGVTYRYVPSLGAWFGVERFEGRDWLVQVPAEAKTGEPVWGSECDVTNVDDDQTVVDRINAALGTTFTLRDFPGR